MSGKILTALEFFIPGRGAFWDRWERGFNGLLKVSVPVIASAVIAFFATLLLLFGLHLVGLMPDLKLSDAKIVFGILLFLLIPYYFAKWCDDNSVGLPPWSDK